MASEIPGVLSLYAVTALAWLGMGSVLGGYNLALMGRHRLAEATVSALSQAHGHAQTFGWLGTVVLGLAFCGLRGSAAERPMGSAKLVWGLWTTGIALRWLTDLSGGQWRLLLPASAALELLAFGVTAGLLLRRSRQWFNPDISTFMLVGGGIGCAIALVMNMTEAITRAHEGHGRLFPIAWENRLLLVCLWGFLSPLAWGLSAKWLPGLMGLKPTRTKILAAAGILDALGIGAVILGKIHVATVLLLHAAIFVPSSLKIFGKRPAPGKINNPGYLRLAFVWLRVAATLGVWASVHDAAGIWGASRHALMVGFLSTLVFVLAYEALPLQVLFSASPTADAAGGYLRVMAPISLVLLNAGCLIHVVSLIFAFQGYGQWAWAVLPLSGLVEFAAFALFAAQVATFLVSHRRRAIPTVERSSIA